MANTSETQRPERSERPPHKSITFAQLLELCDDPARDLAGGVNVRALLTLEPEQGFFLSAEDGETVYQVTDDAGIRVRFRTIEAALGRLQEVSGLRSDIGVFIGGRRHH
jgi:hypothetical protein